MMMRLVLLALAPLATLAHTYIPLEVRYPAVRAIERLRAFPPPPGVTAPRKCPEPIDLVILQQADKEWAGANAGTLKAELTTLIKDIQTEHPNSKFLLATYTNVFGCPTYPHGLVFLDDVRHFAQKYDNLTYTSTGEGYPLDSLTALSIIARDAPWTEGHSRIVLHITGAPPTYYDDGLFSDSLLAKPQGKFACGAEYSPSPSMAVATLREHLVHACHAVINLENPMVQSSWRVFNRLSDQPDNFASLIDQKASNLGALVHPMISKIAATECPSKPSKKRRRRLEAAGQRTRAVQAPEPNFTMKNEQVNINIGGGRPDQVMIKVNNFTYDA